MGWLFPRETPTVFCFFFKSCVEGNRILICMTGQPKSGQPWHPPVPQWHEEEWLPTIFQLCSQFPLPSLLELPLIFSYQFRLPKYHFVSQHPTVFKQGFHRFLLIKHSLVEDKQLGYLNRVTITTTLQILKWRWLNQIVSNYREYHFSNACFLFINFDTGWTENKYVKNLHQILTSSEGQQLKWLPSQGHTCTTPTSQLSRHQTAFIFTPETKLTTAFLSLNLRRFYKRRAGPSSSHCLCPNSCSYLNSSGHCLHWINFLGGKQLRLLQFCFVSK